MRTVYEGCQVHVNPYRQVEREFDTLEAAVAFVDEVGSGRVITWAVGPNLPGCLPLEKYSSCALRVCNDGVWSGVDISR